MDCVACSLCAYSSAVEMAFTANLLLTAWAGVYNFLEDRYRRLASDADDLADDEYIQEEVSIQELRNTLDYWRRIRTTFWWIGLAFSVAFRSDSVLPRLARLPGRWRVRFLGLDIAHGDGIRGSGIHDCDGSRRFLGPQACDVLEKQAQAAGDQKTSRSQSAGWRIVLHDHSGMAREPRRAIERMDKLSRLGPAYSAKTSL